MPIVPFSVGDIVTAAKMVHSIYKALSDSMGASYDYQCLIMELRSFEKALKMVDLAIAVAPRTASYDYQCLIMELRSFEKALKMVDLAIAVAPRTGQYRSGNNDLS